MAYLPPLNGGRVNATIAGNTAGVKTLVSSGTLTLAGGNNITLSQAGNAITISGGAGGGSNTIGMSNLGNTSGTSGVISGSAFRYALAGGNNVTLSQSINGSSGTVTISAASQTVQTQSNIQGVIASGSTNRTGNISFANSNNVTFGLSNNTITASFAGGGGGLALANSQTTYTSGTANLIEGGGALTIASTTGQKFKFSVPAVSALSATGAVSLSTNGSTVSIGVPVQSNQNMGMYAIGNTTGESSQSTFNASSMPIVGGGNVSVGYSAGSMMISGTGGGGGGGIALANSQTTYTSGTANLIEGGGALTIASTTGQKFKFSVPAVSALSATGAVSLSTNGSTVSIGVPVQSNQNMNLYAGGNTTGQSSVSTLNASSLQFIGGGNVSVGYSAGSIQISGTGGGGGGGGGIAMYDGVNSITSGTAQVSAINITASINGQTLNLSVPGTSSIVGAGAVTLSTTGSTMSIGAPVQSNQNLSLYAGGNTTGQSSVSTLNASSLQFIGGGNVSVGYSAGSIQISGTGGGGGGGSAIYTPTAIWGDGVSSASVSPGTITYLRVPYSGTISEWNIVANASCTCVIDIWKLNAALPTVSNSITASAQPGLTTASTASSTTLTGWTTSVAANDVFAFKLVSLSGGTPSEISLVLKVS